MGTVRATAAGTFLSGGLAASDDVNTLAGGMIGVDGISVDSSGTTGVETIMEIDDVPVGPDQMVWAHFCYSLEADKATEAQVCIFEDDVQIQRRKVWIADASQVHSGSISKVSRPDEGNHTYRAVVGVSGGGGATVTSRNDGGDGDAGASELCIFVMGSSF